VRPGSEQCYRGLNPRKPSLYFSYNLPEQRVPGFREVAAVSIAASSIVMRDISAMSDFAQNRRRTQR
jgi:hypothetical protein